MNYEEIREYRRTDVIRRILAIYPEDDPRYQSIIADLKAGKDFSEDLKYASFISHRTYEWILNQKTDNLKNILTTLHDLFDEIKSREFYYNLFIDYVTLFIGFVDTSDNRYSISENPDVSLKLPNGSIDYSKYLAALNVDKARK